MDNRWYFARKAKQAQEWADQTTDKQLREWWNNMAEYVTKFLQGKRIALPRTVRVRKRNDTFDRNTYMMYLRYC